MEIYIDGCLSQLIDGLDRYARNNEIVDLKLWIRLYIYDVLGELAFSQSFGALQKGDESVIPPVTEHVRLSTVAGQIPDYTTQLIKIMSYAPIPWIQRLYKGRAALRELTARCVEKRMTQKDSKRQDLLGRLISAKDPQTGQTLDVIDIQTEAFGMIVAGSHTTATTMTLLFYHLLHSPRAMEKVTRELLESGSGRELAGMKGMSGNVYFQCCIKENLRYTPTFVMPLPRKVPAGGREIAGEFIPAGVPTFAMYVADLCV
jgi:cytochrome P450